MENILTAEKTKARVVIVKEELSGNLLNYSKEKVFSLREIIFIILGAGSIIGLVVYFL